MCRTTQLPIYTSIIMSIQNYNFDTVTNPVVESFIFYIAATINDKVNI